MVSYRATNSFAPNGRCCTLDDLKFMIDKTYDVGLVVPREVFPNCRLRDLLEALMLILPKQFGHLHSRCSRPAQNIENSHCSAMMEDVNDAKDLNVSVPAIEVLIISQPLPLHSMSIWVNEPMDIIKCSDTILKA
ncbi:hypothetical protein Tco_0986467 [Tanacetum coccineum]